MDSTVRIFPSLETPIIAVPSRQDGALLRSRPRDAYAHCKVALAAVLVAERAQRELIPLTADDVLTAAAEAWNAARGRPRVAVSRNLRHLCKVIYIPRGKRILFYSLGQGVAQAVPELEVENGSVSALVGERLEETDGLRLFECAAVGLAYTMRLFAGVDLALWRGSAVLEVLGWAVPSAEASQ
jgi:hypothetical protein